MAEGTPIKTDEAAGGVTQDSEIAAEDTDCEKVEFKVMFCKKKYDISFGLDLTVAKLKEHLHGIIGL